MDPVVKLPPKFPPYREESGPSRIADVVFFVIVFLVISAFILFIVFKE